ncbi:uncharacterized protein LOC125546081 isoform X1 [Triticum urartu]|uniref:uncharacterized protein LOC125546081 isoform X1 n=1 Tax=Triticum urartu TaxID=4572 RepID=UPI0020436EAD|nr:uncharacterized protein LOC125546081 isoform X1 [Triticum urartu]XP_048566174.1 uncharacterized protein LOC125546081 isoform X1 [Triticum urartu]
MLPVIVIFAAILHDSWCLEDEKKPPRKWPEGSTICAGVLMCVRSYKMMHTLTVLWPHKRTSGLWQEGAHRRHRPWPSRPRTQHPQDKDSADDSSLTFYQLRPVSTASRHHVQDQVLTHISNLPPWILPLIDQEQQFNSISDLQKRWN